jgi:SAM-dependent methyltransferase
VLPPAPGAGSPATASADGSLRRRLEPAGAGLVSRLPHARTREALLNRWRAAVHAGRAVRCPLCGWRFARFRDDWNRPGAICWRCGSHERHRALWLFLQARPGLLGGARSLLHFAPEWCLEHRLRRRRGLRYVTADSRLGFGELQLDLRALDLPDACFGAVLCSHVLEHIDDDAAAMRELRRVLTPGGWAVVMVPVDHTRPETYEDPAITAPQDRERHFGQHDHVRLYAPDIAGRLAAAGLEVEAHDVAREAGPAAAARHGLMAVEDVFLCRRPRAGQ